MTTDRVMLKLKSTDDPGLPLRMPVTSAAKYHKLCGDNSRATPTGLDGLYLWVQFDYRLGMQRHPVAGTITFYDGTAYIVPTEREELLEIERLAPGVYMSLDCGCEVQIVSCSDISEYLDSEYPLEIHPILRQALEEQMMMEVLQALDIDPSSLLGGI
jgi:hypothetical protein